MTLRAAIQVYDGMTSPFKTMVNVMGNVINSFETLQDTSSQAVDVQNLEMAKATLAQVGATITQIEESAKRNVEQQQKFNRELQNGGMRADALGGKIRAFAGAYLGMQGARRAKDWMMGSLDIADAQINAERQLKTVLHNVMDGVPELEIGITPQVDSWELPGVPSPVVDAMPQAAQWGALGASIPAVDITPTVDIHPAMSAYDSIAAKAAEIQGYSLYSKTAMIGGAGELATYISDAQAIEQAMGTLVDYAAGMSGGGEVDPRQMVEYATQLGKALDGNFQGLKMKGFEPTEAQKEILKMGDDLERVAVLEDIIAESWAGLGAAMADTPQGAIIQLSNAFSGIREEVALQLYPKLMEFFGVVQDNMPLITDVVMGFGNAIGGVVTVLTWIVDAAANVAETIQNNWDNIAPVVTGVAAAFVAYKVATMAATAAQWAMNAAQAANPVGLVVLAIAALVGLLYAGVAAMNKFAGTSYSATGIIAGAFSALGALIHNRFVNVWNFIAMFVNFFGNAFNDPVAAVQVLYLDLAMNVIGYVRSMAEAIQALINNIPGVEMNIIAGLDLFYDQLEAASQAVKDESGWVEYMGKMDFKNVSDAYNKGYDWGTGVEDKLKGAFDPGDPWENDFDFGAGGITDGLDDIGADTGAIRDAVDITEEDLRYLRDLAEQEVVNRFTTAEIKVDVTNNNTINSGLDLDGVVGELVDGVEEAMWVMAEGVH